MKKHIILDRFIILGTILLLAVGYGISAVIGTFGMGNHTAMAFLSAIGAIVALLVFDLIFKGEFIGFVKGGDTKTGLRICTFMLIYYAYLMIQTIFFGEFQSPGLQSLATSCAAGIGEEALFRGYLISYWFKNKNSAKNIPIMAILCSVLFGLTHAANIFGGAPVSITIVQVIGTIGIGMLLTAIYIRSGNIIIPMITHLLTDFICFMDKSQATSEGIMVANVSFINYVDIVMCLILFGIGLYLIRPSKRDEIVALWNKKWNK